MPRARCRYYDDDGNGSCPRLGVCEFVHPTEPAWDTARPSNRNNNWPTPNIPPPLGTSKPRTFRQGGGKRCRWYEDDGTPKDGGCRRQACTFLHPNNPEWASAADRGFSSQRTGANEFASNANTAPLGTARTSSGSGWGWGNSTNEHQDSTMADNPSGSTATIGDTGWGTTNEDSTGGWGSSGGGWENDSGGGWGSGTRNSGSNTGGWGNETVADKNASADSKLKNDSTSTTEKSKADGEQPTGWAAVAAEESGGWGSSSGAWGVETTGSWGWGATDSDLNQGTQETSNTGGHSSNELPKKPRSIVSGGWGNTESTSNAQSSDSSAPGGLGWGATTSNSNKGTGGGHSSNELSKKPPLVSGGWGNTEITSNVQWGGSGSSKDATKAKETSGRGNSSAAASGGWGSSEPSWGTTSGDLQASTSKSEPPAEIPRITRLNEATDFGYSATSGQLVERRVSVTSKPESTIPQDRAVPMSMQPIPPSPSFTNTSHRSAFSTSTVTKSLAQEPKDATERREFFEAIISTLAAATQAKAQLKEAEADRDRWKRNMSSDQYKHGSRTARERLEAIRDEKHKMVRRHTKELLGLTEDLCRLTGFLGIDIGNGAESKKLQIQIDEIKVDLQKIRSASGTQPISNPVTGERDEDTRQSKRQKMSHEGRPLSEAKALLKAELRQLETKLDDLEQEPISYDVVWQKVSERLQRKLDEFVAEHRLKDQPTSELSVREVFDDVERQKEEVARLRLEREGLMSDMTRQVEDLAAQITKQTETKTLLETHTLGEMQKRFDELQNERKKDAERIRQLELQSEEMREQLRKINASIRLPVVSLPEILSAIDHRMEEYTRVVAKQVEEKLGVARYNFSSQIEEEHQRLLSHIWPTIEKSTHLTDTLCDFFGQYAKSNRGPS